MFDKRTKVPDEPPIPATIFINHDHVCSQKKGLRVQTSGQLLGRVDDIDVVSAERVSESDLTSYPLNIENVV